MSCIEIFGFVANDYLCGCTSSRRKVTMLSKINNALQVAADVIAPPCSRVEDLQYYWHQVVTVCQRCQDVTAGPVPAIEETSVPRHLINMFKVLVAEERENKTVGGPLGPCMEFIVQEKILVSLSSYAWADKPLGIRQHCYMFLIGVLNHIHHSHLLHVQIHKPMQAIIRVICETRASPYESQEIDFLATLCDKIRQDNSLILLYIKPEAVTSRSSISNTEGSLDSSDQITDSECHTKKTEDSKFPLVDAFLNLCHSADCDVSSTAHECLVIIASIKDGCCSETISKYTLFTHYLTSRLVAAVDNIPIDTEPMLLEEASLEPPLSDDSALSDNEGGDVCSAADDFPGKQVLVSFIQWLTYCDRIVLVSDTVLGTSVCETVREEFLDGLLRPGLLSHDEDIVTFHTALISKVVTTINSPLLINCVVSWLCEDCEDRDPSISLRDHLFRQCKSPPHHLRIQTLRLIQLLIQKPGALAVQLLVLNYVMSRGYYDTTTAEHQQSSWSDEEDERSKLREGKDYSPGAVRISLTLAPPNINKIVKRFLGLVPEEMHSTSQDDYNSYKADAQRQYRDMCRVCTSYGWPREALSPECPSEASSTASKESKAEEDTYHFYEGPLLSLLMDFMQNLSIEDYDINLQVTSLVSSLALLPHPHLHEYLLNPFLPLVAGVRTPYTILRNIVNEIQQSITERDDFRNHLKMTRFQLLGTMQELELDRDDDKHKFEAMIVIEEFSKELASIAYAKYTIEGGEC